MNHETLQALYALDVAEVGEGEAAKRWEFGNGNDWHQCHKTPEWSLDRQYRRKPDIPWPKVMQHDTKPEWPADAPEWATCLISVYNNHHGLQTGRTQVVDILKRPKSVLKKIDMGKMLLNPAKYKYGGGKQASSDWIAWNCDENTQGNPLPDGLVVEWYEYTNTKMTRGMVPWDTVTRFRIVGIQRGWE